MNFNQPHKTAIARTALSAPARLLDDQDLLIGRALDFGCGHGTDAEILGIHRWDPTYHSGYSHWLAAGPCSRRPSLVRTNGESFYKLRPFDTIMCNYVLNVISEKEAAGVLHSIETWLKPGGHAYITVRRDMKNASKDRQRLVKLDLPVLHENAAFCIYETWA